MSLLITLFSPLTTTTYYISSGMIFFLQKKYKHNVSHIMWLPPDLTSARCFRFSPKQKVIKNTHSGLKLTWRFIIFYLFDNASTALDHPLFSFNCWFSFSTETKQSHIKNVICLQQCLILNAALFLLLFCSPLSYNQFAHWNDGITINIKKIFDSCQAKWSSR